MATYRQVAGAWPAGPQGRESLTLCMPITIRRKADPADADGAGDADNESATYTRFVYKARWFVLSPNRGRARRRARDPELGRRSSPGSP